MTANGTTRVLTVGLVGPAPMVGRLQNVAEERVAQGLAGVKFVPVIHPHATAAPDKLLKAFERIDVALFVGPLYYDRVLDTLGDAFTIPATFVPLAGDALTTTLLRVILEGRLSADDLARGGGISIDSHSADAVTEALADVGLTMQGVHVAPYEDSTSVDGFTAFHRDLLQSGRSGLALTTIGAVADELRKEGRPVQRVAPPHVALVRAVETAVLLGRGAQLGAQQIAYVLVQLLSSEPTVTVSSWQEEAAVRVHSLLLELCRPSEATVVRRSPLQFGITTTAAGLERLTGGLRHAPFADVVRRRLGISVAVGLGVGHTAVAAVENASAALASSLDAGGLTTTYVDAVGSPHELAAHGTARVTPVADDERRRLEDAAARIAAACPEPEVGVEEIAASLGVTPRSGQRTLRALVEAGLAWPLPTESSPQGGRPRRLVRLLPAADRAPVARQETSHPERPVQPQVDERRG